MHGVKDVGQTEIHTTDPLVPEPSASEFELAIDRLKSDKTPGIDQIPAELIKAGGRTIGLEKHNLVLLYGRRRNCVKSGRRRSSYLLIRRGRKQIVIIIWAYPFANHLQKFIQHPALKVNSIGEGNYLGSSMWFSTQKVDY